MDSAHALRLIAALILAWTGSAGCTVKTSTTGNSTAAQCRIDSDVLCPGDFVGYSCQGPTKPFSTCGSGTLEFDGETGYCCGVRANDTCAVEPAAGCSDGSIGYSCNGAGDPHALDPSLACSVGVAGPSGDTRYCCTGVAAGSCAADGTIAGCAAGSSGFACTGSETPDQTQMSLVCSTATPGPNDESLYCCSTS